jgi:type IV pilus assembly protein PilA
MSARRTFLHHTVLHHGIAGRDAVRATAASRQRGQGMTEYIIIVALIAIAAIAVYQLFGNTIRNQTAAMAQELAGKDGTGAITSAGNAADKAKDQAVVERTLSTYGNQASDGRAQ